MIFCIVLHIFNVHMRGILHWCHLSSLQFIEKLLRFICWPQFDALLNESERSTGLACRVCSPSNTQRVLRTRANVIDATRHVARLGEKGKRGRPSPQHKAKREARAPRVRA